MLVGTWVHGLFVVGQTPWAAAKISNLPAMRGKRAAVFCTFALNPGKSLDRLTGAVQATGADVVGGLALHRSKLEAHSEEFCSRLAWRSCAELGQRELVGRDRRRRRGRSRCVGVARRSGRRRWVGQAR